MNIINIFKRLLVAIHYVLILIIGVFGFPFWLTVWIIFGMKGLNLFIDFLIVKALDILDDES